MIPAANAYTARDQLNFHSAGYTMDMQRRLLRIMLGMLALAAAAGVLAVFISGDVMARVAGTAVLTAVVCALAMPVSKKLDDEKQRAGGLIGLGSLVVAFILGASGIWIEVLYSGWDISFRLALSALVVGVGGIIASMLLDRTRAGIGALAARVGLGADGLAAALFFGSIWTGVGLFPAIDISEKLGMSGLWVMLTGAPAALGLIGAGPRDRPWRWLGVLASVAALVMAGLGIWVIESKNPTSFIAVMTVAVVIGYANVVVRLALGEAGVWAKLIAIGSLAATGGCLTAMSYIGGGLEQPPPDPLVRVTGAGGIVAACSTVGILILYRLNRRTPGTSATVSDIKAVHVVCPHCGKKREAKVGESACAECGLGLSIKVVEPRCAKCDYSLLGIKGGVCPECGLARDVVAA